jgi:hypothetical protein
MTADVLLGDIVERSTRRYLFTEVLNMWEVSMGGSHRALQWYSKCYFVTSVAEMFTLKGAQRWLVCTPLSVHVFVALVTK